MKTKMERHLHLLLIVGCLVICTIVGCKNQKKEKNPYAGKCVVYPEIKDITKKYTTQNNQEYQYQSDTIKSGENIVFCKYEVEFDSASKNWNISIQYDSLMTVYAVVDSIRNIIYYLETILDSSVYVYDSIDSNSSTDSDEFYYIQDKLDPVLSLINNDSLVGTYTISYQWAVKLEEDNSYTIYIQEYNPLVSDIATFAICAEIDSSGIVRYYSNNQWVALTQNNWEWKDWYKNRIKFNLDPIIKDLESGTLKKN